MGVEMGGVVSGPDVVVCLHCLARSDDVADAVWELVEDACGACHRYGPAARRMKVPAVHDPDQLPLLGAV